MAWIYNKLQLTFNNLHRKINVLHPRDKITTWIKHFYERTTLAHLDTRHIGTPAPPQKKPNPNVLLYEYLVPFVVCNFLIFFLLCVFSMWDLDISKLMLYFIQSQFQMRLVLFGGISVVHIRCRTFNKTQTSYDCINFNRTKILA